MIAMLLTLITAVSAQESAESKFARGLLRRLATEKAAPVVIFTAEPGKSCRAIIDAVGIWSAQIGPIHLVDGGPTSVLDFLEAPGDGPSRFHKFAGETDRGTVIVQRAYDGVFEDRIAAKLGTLILNGEDRRHWRTVSTAKLAFFFEARPTAPLLGRRLVRDVTKHSEITATHDGCTYHFMTAEAVRSLATNSCSTQLTPAEKSGWYRPDELAD